MTRTSTPIPLVAAILMLFGCETPGPASSSGEPVSGTASYEQGFDDGCEAGFESSFNEHSFSQQNRFDADYDKGWKEGYYSCRARPDVLRRRSNRRRR